MVNFTFFNIQFLARRSGIKKGWLTLFILLGFDAFIQKSNRSFFDAFFKNQFLAQMHSVKRQQLKFHSNSYLRINTIPITNTQNY